MIFCFYDMNTSEPDTEATTIILIVKKDKN